MEQKIYKFQVFIDGTEHVFEQRIENSTKQYKNISSFYSKYLKK